MPVLPAALLPGALFLALAPARADPAPVAPRAALAPTDLDGDGQPEHFVQTAETLTVGATRLDCGAEPFPCELELHDLTAKDGQRELATCHFGPRDDRYCTLYRFENNALVEIPIKDGAGRALHPSRVHTKGNGILLVDRDERFLTRRDKLLHRGGGALAFVAQPFHDAGQRKVPVDRSFPLTLRPDGGPVVANVAPGTTVTLVLADATRPQTFLVLVSSGLLGWADIETIARGSDAVMGVLGAG